jgi:F-type H+-transporting ATPase subunit alpha
MKKVAGMLRLDLAQYRELETFAKFGTELDKETRKQLSRGERTVEILKQSQYKPMDVEDQVLIIYALTKGFLDDIEVKKLQSFEKEYLEYMHSSHLEIINEIRNKKDIDYKLEQNINKAITSFKQTFN